MRLRTQVFIVLLFVFMIVVMVVLGHKWVHLRLLQSIFVSIVVLAALVVVATGVTLYLNRNNKFTHQLHQKFLRESSRVKARTNEIVPEELRRDIDILYRQGRKGRRERGAIQFCHVQAVHELRAKNHGVTDIMARVAVPGSDLKEHHVAAIVALFDTYPDELRTLNACAYIDADLERKDDLLEDEHLSPWEFISVIGSIIFTILKIFSAILMVFVFITAFYNISEVVVDAFTPPVKEHPKVDVPMSARRNALLHKQSMQTEFSTKRNLEAKQSKVDSTELDHEDAVVDAQHKLLNKLIPTLEILLLAPLIYLITMSLLRYAENLTLNKDPHETRSEVMVVKALGVSLLIALVSTKLTGDYLKNGEIKPWALWSGLAIIVVFGSYFVAMEILAMKRKDINQPGGSTGEVGHRRRV